MAKFMKLAKLPLIIGGLLATSPVYAGGIDPYVGEIAASGRNFCQLGWLPADGALMSIVNNEVLFVLIGTTYGGDGQTTFALPDLRGRLQVGDGTGPGLATKVLGQLYGAESTTMSITTMPAHSHVTTIKAHAAAGNSAATVRGRFAQSTTNNYTTSGADVSMAAGDVALAASTGGSNPITTMQPYLTVKYCIATEGIFPPQP
jgi:microcystin-dependent protein